VDPWFVLVHSPALGPATWAPAAAALSARGRDVLLPPLTGLADADPPYWLHAVRNVVATVRAAPDDRPLVLVAHGNAGLLVPALVANAPRDVAACLFVDATVPLRDGWMTVTPPAARPLLRALAEQGRLPPWTQWWEPADAAALFPDEHTRALVEEQEPRLPLAYFEEPVPAPAGWDERPCGYLRFSETYSPAAGEANERGWPVAHLPGGHLHQLTDPVGVARRLAALADELLAPR
jgi:pimeloyl-ACP methyl ester carboxylesterase